MVTFRKATSADADTIAQLYRALVPNSRIHVLPERIVEIEKDKNTYLVVCDIAGNVIATALVILCNDAMFACQPFAIIENIMVSKCHQRTGIGKSLMAHIEEFCVAQDCSKIMLLSGSDNLTAHNFYEAMGYNSDSKLGFIKKRSRFNQ